MGDGVFRERITSAWASFEPHPHPVIAVLALHSQPVRTAQSHALRNPVLTPLEGEGDGKAARGGFYSFGGT